MRLFVAVLPDERAKETLVGAQESLRAQTVGGNFTAAGNLHLTLAFIGETDDAAPVKKALGRVVGPAFETKLSGAGSFSDLWWVGTESTSALLSLSEKVRSALDGAGIGFDRKPFRPHITIARRIVYDGARPEIKVEKTVYPVRKISLMSSERAGGVLVYRQIFCKNLG